MSRWSRQGQRQSGWSRAGSWLRGSLCARCFCSCCAKTDEGLDRPRVNQATATAERVSRPHRPHAPGSRKSTPAMLSAVQCALSQLQGEPAPPLGQPLTVAPALGLDEELCKATVPAKRVNYFSIKR